MNRKAQSALEYLMTYGWALIVIAIVIGILWYVTSSATGGVTCQSRSNNFVVKAQAVSANLKGVNFTLQNGSGQSVTVTSAAGSGDFNGATTTVLPATVAANGTIDIKEINAPIIGTTFSNGVVNVGVTIGTLPATVEIICSGKV